MPGHWSNVNKQSVGPDRWSRPAGISLGLGWGQDSPSGPLGPTPLEGHIVARPPSVEKCWCLWRLGGRGRWELSQQAQREAQTIEMD